MSKIYKDAVYWIEVEKIVPNPYQPRRDFDEKALDDLADSIRQYGVLQPLVLTKKEKINPEGGMSTHYELIAGERRYRASKLAGLKKVPAIIRDDEDDEVKLELAIIENLQREDLNAIDRAKAFFKLHDEFHMTHAKIGKKLGKSREYVSNSIRLLGLPEKIQEAVAKGSISEGHARSLLMLKDHPEEQHSLYKEIIYKRMTVRDAEKVARGIATERIRDRKKYDNKDTQLRMIERKFRETLGTRVQIEKNRGNGGKITIDYFDENNLNKILTALESAKKGPYINVPEELEASVTHIPEPKKPKTKDYDWVETVKSREEATLTPYTPPKDTVSSFQEGGLPTPPRIKTDNQADDNTNKVDLTDLNSLEKDLSELDTILKQSADNDPTPTEKPTKQVPDIKEKPETPIKPVEKESAPDTPTPQTGIYRDLEKIKSDLESSLGKDKPAPPPVPKKEASTDIEKESETQKTEKPAPDISKVFNLRQSDNTKTETPKLDLNGMAIPKKPQNLNQTDTASFNI